MAPGCLACNQEKQGSACWSGMSVESVACMVWSRSRGARGLVSCVLDPVHGTVLVPYAAWASAALAGATDLVLYLYHASSWVPWVQFTGVSQACFRLEEFGYHGTATRNVCVYCGGQGPMTRDHVVPQCRLHLVPKKHHRKNIVWCCTLCNRDKGSRSLCEWVLDAPWTWRTLRVLGLIVPASRHPALGRALETGCRRTVEQFLMTQSVGWARAEVRLALGAHVRGATAGRADHACPVAANPAKTSTGCS